MRKFRLSYWRSSAAYFLGWMQGLNKMISNEGALNVSPSCAERNEHRTPVWRPPPPPLPVLEEAMGALQNGHGIGRYSGHTVGGYVKAASPLK